jgi:hypothetical protein
MEAAHVDRVSSEDLSPPPGQVSCHEQGAPAEASAGQPKAVSIKAPKIVCGFQDRDNAALPQPRWPCKFRLNTGKVVDVELVPLGPNEHGIRFKPGELLTYVLMPQLSTIEQYFLHHKR